ncbi:MAG: ABC transporter ATP-binding protein [Gaiellaceae bacterium]
MAEIKLDKLGKRFPNGFWAVKDLSLEIAEAELLVLVGPSGCGKTTALRMIAGLEDISEGDLYIGGSRVNDVLERDRDIAMVFQNYALYPHMTVAQNIAFSLKLQRRPKKEIKQRVQEAAKLLGLEELLDRKPKQLSGGQKQRVAMGRAIIRQPQVFLMDEPLSNLDAQLRVHMRGEIEALQKRLGVTTVYVTHDQVEAMTMGDRVAVLRGGELQQVDTPTNVYDGPANLFVAGFIGSPPMNLARGTIDAVDGELVARLGSATVMIPTEVSRERGLEVWLGREVIVGIRPEDLGGPSGASRGRDVMLAATVDRVEELGSDLLCFYTMDAPPATSEAIAEATGGGLEEVALITREGTPFCATYAPRSEIRVGDKVDVTVDAHRLHFFDPETESAIGT